jgi:translation elongation factor EF-4
VKVFGSKIIKELGGEVVTITNPLNLPEKQNILITYEPFVLGTIITPGIVSVMNNLMK